MNILYLTNVFSDSVGGGENMFWLYAKYMAKRGHKIQVICYKHDEDSLARLNVQEGSISILELLPTIEHKGMLLQDFSTNIEYVGRGLKVLKSMYRDLDLIHSNTYTPAFLGGVAKILYKVRHIVTVHDLATPLGNTFLYRWFREGGNSSLASYIKSIAASLYESSLVNILPKDAVLVPSKLTMQDVKMMTLKKDPKVHVIPPFIDVETYEVFKSKHSMRYEPCILYIGRLVFYKNVHRLVRVFPKVLQERRDAKFIIVGNGPLRDLLYGWVQRQGLGKSILLTTADQAEKARLLSACSAVVNPSIFEGFGLTILESWFFEKPVIVGDVPPLNELVENGKDGFIIDLHDDSHILRALLEILNDLEMTRRMGLNGFSKVLKYYSPTVVLQQLEKLYNSIIQR